MKKILIVTKFFYPENTPRAFRATELANEFAAQGHAVTIITLRNEHIHSELEKKHGYIIKDLGKLFFKPVTINGSGIALKIKLIWRRLLLLLFEYPDIQLMWLVKRALITENDYDLMISNAVPHPVHWGVAWAYKGSHCIAKTWVADCGDPYMGCKTDSFKKLFYFKFIEDWWCEKVDYISLPNIDHIAQYYLKFHSKIKIIPQGFKFENAELYKGDINNSVPTFAFAGVLLKGARNPEPFLAYLCGVKIDFKFIIYTQSTDLLDKYRPILKDKLEIRDYITRDELLFKLSKMDFVLNIEFSSHVNSNSPSKLADYAIVDRPILSLNMENLDCRKIDEFLRGNYSNKMILFNTERFQIENVVKSFCSLIKEK